jgi:hypothetical protein
MKQQFIKYKDILLIAELTNNDEIRFNLTPLVLFVVDSNGRNSIVAFCLTDRVNY